MVNKKIAEHGGPNCTELNWQACLNFSSTASQNEIKRVVIIRQNKTQVIGFD